MDLKEFRDNQRRLWAQGNYRPVGELLKPASLDLVDNAEIRPGMKVLDVGTGTGNVAIAAAKRGAEVVAVDIAETWWDAARAQADDAGVEIDLRLGDAEDLDFLDGSFDAVLSSFAAIFAPRHKIAAAEMLRVCDEGGLLGLNAWPPDGTNRIPMRPIFERLPPGQEFGAPYVDWGDPNHVRNLFRRHSVELEMGIRYLPANFESVASFQQFLFANSGGFIAAKAALEEMGSWEEAYAEMGQLLAETNESDDGSYSASWNYLQILATKTG